jgi:two-component system, LytTR family, sensor kinase
MDPEALDDHQRALQLTLWTTGLQDYETTVVIGGARRSATATASTYLFFLPFRPRLSVFQVYVQSKVEQHTVKWQDLVYAASHWLLVGVFVPLIYRLGKRFAFSRARLRSWLFIHSAGAFGLCVGLTSLGFLVATVLEILPRYASLSKAYATWMLGGLPFAISIYFALLGCVYAYAYFIEARQREADAARLEAQLSQARLGALRMQLNPHFLFNSLNALSALVREQDTPAASRMLELIADVLRQVLRSDQPHEIPLSEEIAFVAQYLEIEQVRFSDRLDIRWKVQESAMSALVPSFIMQPIVENAIKHGVLKTAESGVVEIFAEVRGQNVEIKVLDNGEGIHAPASNVGVGLSNTRERLRTLYGDEARLSLHMRPTGGTEATISLPHRVQLK